MGGWSPEELQALDAVFAAFQHRGDAEECAVATTGHGDPQYFLLGPAPDHECVLSISRVRGWYVLEDGNGRVLKDADDLATLIDAASRVRLRRVRSALVAKCALAWWAVREYVEERTDAALEEAIEAVELLGHFAPQAAMLA